MRTKESQVPKATAAWRHPLGMARCNLGERRDSTLAVQSLPPENHSSLSSYLNFWRSSQLSEFQESRRGASYNCFRIDSGSHERTCPDNSPVSNADTWHDE